MAVIERRREFGVLAAVGWSRLGIGRLILGDCVWQVTRVPLPRAVNR
ncbi:MAG TPA: hypothetical protein VEF89_28755 [Solirubrobacteraceae bacterium]|nr:hypothetical protein [Solirubrobacteraceae bacterium]